MLNLIHKPNNTMKRKNPNIWTDIFGPIDSFFNESSNLFTNTSPFLNYKTQVHRYKKTEDGHTYEFDMPGVIKENVTIQADNGILTVSFKVVNLYGEQSETYSVNLPVNTDLDSAKASMDNGVLTVVFTGKSQGKQILIT